MAFKVLMRTGGVVLFGLVLILRACVFSSAFHHMSRAAPHAGIANNGAYGTASQTDYRNAVPAMATDTSAWIMFNSTDPQTGLLTRHSRLTAPSTVIIDGQPAPPNVLELMEQGRDDHHIRLTLQAPSTCPGITSVHAMFGTRPATIAVKTVSGTAGCTVDMLDYTSILQSLRNTDILTIRAGDGPEIRFAVAGLSWD